MPRDRVPISASALGLAACLSLLALPPVPAGVVAASPDAAVRVAEARRCVTELFDSLRESVQQRGVRPASVARCVGPARAIRGAASTPIVRSDAGFPPPLPPALARLVNLPPPAIG